MAINKDKIVCPYCKHTNRINMMIGNMGLINHNGTTKEIICEKCDKEFDCEMIVELKFKTTKI